MLLSEVVNLIFSRYNKLLPLYASPDSRQPLLMAYAAAGKVHGQRKHAIAHYLDLAAAGRVDLRPMLTHTFGLGQRREAFHAIANQGESGAVEVAIGQR